MSHELPRVLRAATMMGLAVVAARSNPEVKKGVMFSSAMSLSNQTCTTNDNYVGKNPNDPTKIISGVCYDNGHAFGLWSFDAPETTKP